MEPWGERLTVSVAGLDAGEWIIRVSLHRTKDGDMFGAWYDMPLRVTG